jgi:hypothetical protein
MADGRAKGPRQAQQERPQGERSLGVTQAEVDGYQGGGGEQPHQQQDKGAQPAVAEQEEGQRIHEATETGQERTQTGDAVEEPSMCPEHAHAHIMPVFDDERRTRFEERVRGLVGHTITSVRRVGLVADKPEGWLRVQDGFDTMAFGVDFELANREIRVSIWNNELRMLPSPHVSR